MSTKNYWVTGILSWLCPGLGHFYLSKIKLGIVLMLLNLLFMIIIHSGLAFTGAYLYLISSFTPALYALVVTLHSLLLAHKRKREILNTKYNKWFMLITNLMEKVLATFQKSRFQQVNSI